MAPTATALVPRRYEDCTFDADGYIDESSCYVPFWSTRAGSIVKWALFLGIIVAVGLYLLVGYVHAKKRIQKGLPPLSYHRFLVSRATLARVDPRYRHAQPAHLSPYTPEQQYYYDMQAMPPPVYDPNAPRPPMYEPPAGSTKVEPNQQGGAGPAQQSPGQQAAEGAASDPPAYTPPPGPPPSTARP